MAPAISRGALAVAFALLLRTAAAAALRLRERRSDFLPDGGLRFHEATFVASHNAHASLAVAEGFLQQLGANQEGAIADQLAAGVRALLLDIRLDDEGEEPLRLVHATTLYTLDYGGFRTVLASDVVPFLEGNGDAVLSLFLQTNGDVGEGSAAVRKTILGHLRDVFSSLAVNGAPLKDMTFRYDDGRWGDHDEWPTLEEIRRSGQRIFLFSDRSEFSDPEYGFMHDRQVLRENDWQGIDDCEERYMWSSQQVSLPSNNAWTRLFLMNHFCCGAGPDAKGGTVGEGLIGGGKNGWGVLYPRVRRCMSNNGGFRPNFIALDWVSQVEEALQIRDYLNFGGRLGTGQTCTQDSHCATSSCHIELGLCQCRECPADAAEVCPGCGSGEYCSLRAGGGMNECRDESVLAQILNLTASQGEPTGGEDAPTLAQILNLTAPPPAPLPSKSNSPSRSQTPTDFRPEDSFFCGDDYFSTVSNCNDAVKCPGGNDDCPGNQTCFAGITDCTPPPTLFPSHGSADSPSRSPLSSGQSPSSIAAGAGGAPTAGGGEPPLPTGPGPEWLANLGPTDSPSSPKTASSTGVPSARPTRGPFDFNNTYFCGANYTDAEENCYASATPCPSGAPSVCGGGTCFGGIACAAPPSASPTKSFPGTSPLGPPRTSAPFDEELYHSTTNGATSLATGSMSWKSVLSSAIAIGFVELAIQ